MDARSYSGFLLLMEQALSTVSILAVGAQELQCNAVSDSLRDSVQCLGHAITLFREYVPSVGNHPPSDKPEGGLCGSL